MSRSTQEWRGKTPDTRVPDHVQLRVYLKFDGICPKCTRKLVRGQWQCDHITALINGGQNRESNLQPLCTSPCHSQKTRTDVAEKAITYRKRAKHVGLLAPKQKLQSRGFPKRPAQSTATRPITRKQHSTGETT